MRLPARCPPATRCVDLVDSHGQKISRHVGYECARPYLIRIPTRLIREGFSLVAQHVCRDAKNKVVGRSCPTFFEWPGIERKESTPEIISPSRLRILYCRIVAGLIATKTTK
jgi:hypothetical protein